MPSSVHSFGGEFKSRIFEAEYRNEHLSEFLRQARLCFLFAFIVNPLFVFTDWRFRGTQHFYFAISARATIEISSLAAQVILLKAQRFRSYEFICITWACLVIPASAILVSTHTDIALLVAFILPAIFYLAIPLSFLSTLTCGACCSMAVLAAYLLPASLSKTSFGLVAGMVMCNAVFTLVLSQSNRLRRLEWSATRAEHSANTKLAKSRDVWQKFLKSVPAPLIITAKNSGRFIQANDSAIAYFAIDSSTNFFKLSDCFDRSEWDKLISILQSKGRVPEFETRIRRPDGTEKDVLLTATSVAIEDTDAILMVFIDITSRKHIEALMKQLANTDPLTGLPNRARFFSRAADEIQRTKRHNRPLAVFMIDIDFFKRVNDTYGHEFGDLTLKAFAKLCRKWTRQQDTMGRLGGEEFGLLLPETDADSALVLANRLRTAVENLQIGHSQKSITISIGVSEVLANETTVDAALSRADQALYSAKRSGRNLAVVYKRPN